MITQAHADTFAEYLRPLIPNLPPALISPEAFARITETAGALPGSLAVSVFGFECKLGEEAPLADFQLQATAAFNARRSIANIASTAPHLLAHPIWQRLREFAVEWSDPASPMHLPLYNLWLEFDMEGPPSQPPVPSVFFGLRTEEPGGEMGNRQYLESLPSICLHALGLLRGNRVPDAVGDTLTRSMVLLPHNARVGFVGAMLPRDIDAFRLIINGLDKETIPGYLERIGWTGPIQELAAALEATTPFSDYLWLNVDVGEAVYPKVSWECYIHRQSRNSADLPRWQALLDFLVERGMCTPEKREAMLLYPGIQTAEESGEFWPESLRLLSRVLGPLGFSSFIRGIHHIKVVFQPGKPLEAKAYLYARYE
ncbi:MAG TPA: hypothetical protein VEW94_01080 [Chloroflexia bacterium]|nr:hypothetical protein [Chloroflexia bacterium]